MINFCLLTIFGGDDIMLAAWLVETNLRKTLFALFRTHRYMTKGAFQNSFLQKEKEELGCSNASLRSY